MGKEQKGIALGKGATIVSGVLMMKQMGIQMERFGEALTEMAIKAGRVGERLVKLAEVMEDKQEEGKDEE